MIEPYDLRKRIELYGAGLLLLIALVYGIFRIYPLLLGPRLVVYSPLDGASVASTTFEISGKVSRVKEMIIQGRNIPIDTEGNFHEMMVAQAPFTLITITATDFYGKSVTKSIRVIPK